MQVGSLVKCITDQYESLIAQALGVDKIKKGEIVTVSEIQMAEGERGEICVALNFYEKKQPIINGELRGYYSKYFREVLPPMDIEKHILENIAEPAPVIEPVTVDNSSLF